MRPPETLDPQVERELDALDAALRGDDTDPALAELVAVVRDERPAPPPGFAIRMDRRAENGFPREGARSARLAGPLRRRVRLGFGPALGVAASILLALVVVAASLDGTADEESGGGGSAATSAAEAPAQSAQESAGGAADSAGDTAGSAAGRSVPEGGGVTEDSVAPPMAIPPAPAPGSDADRRRNRKVERSAALTLAAPRDEVASVGDRIIRVTDAAGGFVQTSSLRQDDQTGGSGTYELRVPAARLDRTLAELSRLAHVRERAQNAQDITAESVSARSRLADARAERRALLRQFGRADTPEETARIRRRLAVVGRQIQAAKADARRVDNRAAFASVSVTLVADDAVAGGVLDEDGRWTPADAVGDALRVLEFAAGAALVALAIALPLALLAVPAAVVWRQGVRRRRERALDAV